MSQRKALIWVGTLAVLALPLGVWIGLQLGQGRGSSGVSFDIAVPRSRSSEDVPAQDGPPETETPPETEDVPAAADLEEADLQAIRDVIDSQLQAFQADDASTAFRFASPDIQQQFKTPDNFMAMVRAHYQPVYRPRSVNFEDIEMVRGKPVQSVTLLGPDGQWVTAYYRMERQENDEWRISGCVLVPLEGEAI